MLMCSAFHARAELHGSLSNVRTAMKSMPNVEVASTGTIMRFIIRETESPKSALAIMAFTNNDITFTFYFNEPNVSEYKKNLLKFMSILAYLKDFYTINMRDLYAYVIEALRHCDYMMAREAGSAYDLSKERMNALSGVNISLSHELSLRNARIKAIESELATYRSFSEEVIKKLVQRSNKLPSDAIEILSAIGIDSKLTNAVVPLICERATGARNSGWHD